MADLLRFYQGLQQVVLPGLDAEQEVLLCVRLQPHEGRSHGVYVFLLTGEGELWLTLRETNPKKDGPFNKEQLANLKDACCNRNKGSSSHEDTSDAFRYTTQAVDGGMKLVITMQHERPFPCVVNLLECVLNKGGGAQYARLAKMMAQQINISQKRAADARRERQEALNKNESVLLEVDQLTETKNRLAHDLMSKFVCVLNEKKERIRQLEERVAQLESGGPAFASGVAPHAAVPAPVPHAMAATEDHKRRFSLSEIFGSGSDSEGEHSASTSRSASGSHSPARPPRKRHRPDILPSRGVPPPVKQEPRAQMQESSSSRAPSIADSTGHSQDDHWDALQ